MHVACWRACGLHVGLDASQTLCLAALRRKLFPTGCHQNKGQKTVLSVIHKPLPCIYVNRAQCVWEDLNYNQKYICMVCVGAIWNL